MKVEENRLGIILSGVTGRMGSTQHLERSIVAIMNEGGIKAGEGRVIMPDPILVGRNEAKLAALAKRFGLTRFTTNLEEALEDPYYRIFFDSSTTELRKPLMERAIRRGKAVYCEKPVALNAADALDLYALCKKQNLKNGVVQDKLWLPGLRKLMMIKEQGFFGQILSVRGEFGYWVFDGKIQDQPAQRPSWNYQKEKGGGIVVDMHCHWQYIIKNLFGNVRAVSCTLKSHIPERIGEDGKAYSCTADDAAYATFQLDNGIICQFNSSWSVRVRRDDLLTLQVDGTKGSAVAGLRRCFIQPHSMTPRVVWNPDQEVPSRYPEQWTEVPDALDYENAFKAQWKLFIRHLVLNEPFPWSLLAGAQGVQLAEKSLESHASRAWVELEALE